MQKRIHDIIEIKDLKDMLKKSGEVYGDRPAYKIRKNTPGEFDIITHKEFRNMVDAFRNSINKTRIKRKENCGNSERIDMNGDYHILL